MLDSFHVPHLLLAKEQNLLFDVLLLFLLLLLPLLSLLEETVSLGNPLFAVFQLLFWNVALHNSIFSRPLPPQVKQVLYIVESLVVLLNVCSKAFIFKIQIESLKGANVANRILIFSYIFFFLSQLRKLIDYSAWKNFCNDFTSYQNIGYFKQKLNRDHIPLFSKFYVSNSSRSSLQYLVRQKQHTSILRFAHGTITRGTGKEIVDDLYYKNVEYNQHPNSYKELNPSFFHWPYDESSHLNPCNDIY